MRVIEKIRFKEESGAVLVIVALCLVALFGMVALAVDIGGLAAKRRSLVNAADSAALAAAYSFAMEEQGSECGTNEALPMAKADEFALTNVAGASRLPGASGWLTDCEQQTVLVGYGDVQRFFFAQVLGIGDQAQVRGMARAQWGISSGGTPMPIELDMALTYDCALDPNGDPREAPYTCPEGFWFDRQDLTNSGWGLMNLNTWGIPRDGSCNNRGGENQLGEWIRQQDSDFILNLTPGGPAVFVCTTDGQKAPNWFDDLSYWTTVNDEVLLFPVNDPCQMVPIQPGCAGYPEDVPDSLHKYAIVNWAPMSVLEVWEGDEPEAIGSSSPTPCRFRHTFMSGATQIDLDTTTFTPLPGYSCPSGGGWSVSRKPTVNQPANRWDYNADTHVITWTGPVPTDVEIQFDWRSGGACAGHAPSSTAWCVVLEWRGPQLIGVDPVPDNGAPGLARSIRLVE